MKKKLSTKPQTTLIYALIGAIAGYLVGMATPWVTTTSGLILGALFGVLLSGVLVKSRPRTVPSRKLLLREEKLDITKKTVQTGRVDVHTEVHTEDQMITVPVTSEELVIGKQVIDPETSMELSPEPEIIRIPLTTEKVEVIKHPVKLEDVSIYLDQIQETKPVIETLKVEQVKVKTKGKAKVSKQPRKY